MLLCVHLQSPAAAVRRSLAVKDNSTLQAPVELSAINPLCCAAAAAARCFALKLGVQPDRVLQSLLNDRVVAKGLPLQWATAFFSDYLATESMDDLVRLSRPWRCRGEGSMTEAALALSLSCGAWGAGTQERGYASTDRRQAGRDALLQLTATTAHTPAITC